MIIEIELLTIQVARVKANFVNIIYDGDFPDPRQKSKNEQVQREAVSNLSTRQQNKLFEILNGKTFPISDIEEL